MVVFDFVFFVRLRNTNHLRNLLTQKVHLYYDAYLYATNHLRTTQPESQLSPNTPT